MVLIGWTALESCKYLYHLQPIGAANLSSLSEEKLAKDQPALG
jgi:hypothetical protein